jgi:hypothetical protein
VPPGKGSPKATGRIRLLSIRSYAVFTSFTRGRGEEEGSTAVKPSPNQKCQNFGNHGPICDVDATRQGAVNPGLLNSATGMGQIAKRSSSR